MSNQTIRLDGVQKSFSNGEQSFQVLRDITFIGHEQELIVLMGPSGSGKTTLISILGGILDQDSGECLILDKAINTLPVAQKTQFRGKNIGFMFQYFTLVPTLTAVENASLALLCMGYDRNQAFAEAVSFLKEVDLERQMYKYPDQLSGGEQQRVAIARACLHKPRIILCDEPTSFLDHERGKRVMEILSAIKEQQRATVIVITHDPRNKAFADRVIYIEDGVLLQM